jgi:hypothetical protein
MIKAHSLTCLVLVAAFSVAAKEVKGPISANTIWQAMDSPYVVSGAIIVQSNVTLTIEAGTTIQLGANVDLVVTNGGRLLAEGTPAKPIRFSGVPQATERWGGIIVSGDEDSPETRIRHASIEGNNYSAIYAPGGTLLVEHVVFGTRDRQYMSVDESSFVVSDCYFPPSTGAFEMIHGTRGIKLGGRGIVQRCFFGGTHGYNDVIDFRGGNRDRSQPIIQFYNNVFTGTSDDMLDLDGTDAWIEGNIFLHGHRNGAPDTSSAISGGNHRRYTSQVTIIGNLFYDCDHAATAKEGNFFALINNTIVHMTKAGGVDSADAAICVRDLEPAPTDFAEGCYLEGNIIADVRQLVRNYDKAETKVTFVNNLLPSAWEGPGTGNVIADAKLKHIPQLAETQFTNWLQAQVVREWFSLSSGSPAIGTGPNGRDKGGVIAFGASISGEPKGTTHETSAKLIIGVNRKGQGIPEFGWPDGAGYTHYKWRLDTGKWSEETSIEAPISLGGLSDGPHYVEVIGKRDSGSYQNDAIFGSDAITTRSQTWTVESSADARQLTRKKL